MSKVKKSYYSCHAGLALKFRSMPVRSMLKKAYETGMAAYRSRVETKISEAEHYITGCRLALAFQHHRFFQIAELLCPDDSDEGNEQLRLDLIRLHLLAEQS